MLNATHKRRPGWAGTEGPTTADTTKSPTSGLLHKALLDKGDIKATNFRNKRNKRAYLYQLTPKGIAAKSRATKRFLARKQDEYERLAQEIETLKHEVQSSTSGGSDVA